MYLRHDLDAVRDGDYVALDSPELVTNIREPINLTTGQAMRLIQEIWDALDDKHHNILRGSL